MRNRTGCALLLGIVGAFSPIVQADSVPLPGLDALYPSLRALYEDLHRHPEISLQEKRTASIMAAQLRDAGCEVTEGVGGTGVVGVLRNGDGPVVMLRTDMDALPMPERTGLPYASTATAVSASGETVPAMHACGHDVHMASWVGAAHLLASMKDQWRGTVVFIGQPAEEIVHGARDMIADGLFERFPRPDFVLGVHVTNELPAGTIGVTSGPASAASNAVDVTFFGKGGHGAAPHLTVDPILIAARTVVTLQSIVAREVSPFEPAVVTVGTFHAGTKRNIIPDSAKIELTVRSYSSEIQAHLLEAITRISKAESAAAGAPREPEVRIDPSESSDVVVNDPALAKRLADALRADLGESRIVPLGPVPTSEDFGTFGRVAGAPSIQFRIGAVEPGVYAAAAKEGRVHELPGPHNSMFAPDAEPTIRTGVAVFTHSTLELLRR